MQRLVDSFDKIYYVIHAAALKQVGAVEENKEEAYKTNILGTSNVIEACMEKKVEKLIFISSDKAVSPINYYGETKMQGEKLIKDSTLNSKIVRLGNLIGSRGSVLEAFEYQSQKGLLYVSDLNVERYFISLNDAAKSIVFALLSEFPQNILVPFAEKKKLKEIIEEKYPNIPIQIYGLKTYERLQESLYNEDELNDCLLFK